MELPANKDPTKVRVSDMLTPTVLDTLPRRSTVLINAGVGKGKTYWSILTLGRYAETKCCRVLYIVNRNATKTQSTRLVEYGHLKAVVTITSYQAIEIVMQNAEVFHYECYDYIVLDESQRLSVDTMVDKVAHFIEKDLRNIDATVFYMSGTPHGVDDILRELAEQLHRHVETIRLPAAYGNIRMATYKNKKDVFKIIDAAIAEGVKAMVISANSKLLLDIRSKYGTSKVDFLCSVHNTKLKQYMDNTAREQILESEVLDKPILAATTAIDTGFNLKDPSVKYVICDMKDLTSLWQAVGRRRLSGEGDTFDVYVPELPPKEIKNMIDREKHKLRFWMYWKEHGDQAYMEYKKLFPNIPESKTFIQATSLLDGKVAYEELIFHRNYVSHKISQYESILASGKSYLEYLIQNEFKCKRVPKNENPLRSAYKKTKTKDKNKLLESFIGKRIYKEDRAELLQILGYYNSKSMLIKKAELLKLRMGEEKGLKYTLVEHPKCSVKGERKAFWEIVRK